MRDRFVALISEYLERDPALALVLADIGVARFKTPSDSVYQDSRIFNVGIREPLAIGVAAGLALEGFTPVVHTYAPFLVERPFEQIKIDLVHQGLRAVLVSIGASFDAAAEGRTHQAPGDVALLSTLPGLRAELPGHADEVEAAFDRALAHDGLTYLRLSTAGNAEPRNEGIVRVGRRGTVLAIGPVLDAVLEASNDLDITVIYTPTALPLGVELIGRHVGPQGLAVVEPVLEGTSVPALSAVFRTPITAIGVKRTELRRYGTAEDHRAAHGLDARSIRVRLEEWLSTDGLVGRRKQE